MLLAMCVAVVHAHYALIGSKIGMMARIMTTNAVYEKVLYLCDVCMYVCIVFV